MNRINFIALSLYRDSLKHEKTTKHLQQCIFNFNLLKMYTKDKTTCLLENPHAFIIRYYGQVIL